MLWELEIHKEIQRQENRIVVGASPETIKDAETTMENLIHTYIKQTKPVAKAAEVNYIGRSTYDSKGKLIGFYLEPIYRNR